MKLETYKKKNVKHYLSHAGVTTNTYAPAGPTEEEYESGNGPSLPQSPVSLDPPPLDSDDDEKLLAK